MERQRALFDVYIEDMTQRFPSTRYQGSKAKLLDWIWNNIKDLEFDTCLDAFGGTGSVSYLMKAKGKEVTFNDVLKFNYFIGKALIENSRVCLTGEDLNFLFVKHPGINYPNLIQSEFKGIYYTDEENEWLDMIVTNIRHLGDEYKKALALFCLFQACLVKRPFNLFHRKNLYLRTANVKRTFGNKATWDTPFPEHFRQFASEANQAIFDNGRNNRALNLDAFDIKGVFDLVYIDTPYLRRDGAGVDYLEFYHFLEGLADYDYWKARIDYRSKHKKMKNKKSVWGDKRRIYKAFDRLFQKFRESILVVSYRSGGIPSEKEMVRMLAQYKKGVKVYRKSYKYVLSDNGSEELIFVAP